MTNNTIIKKRNIAALVSSLVLIAMVGSTSANAVAGPRDLPKPTGLYVTVLNPTAAIVYFTTVLNADSYTIRICKNERSCTNTTVYSSLPPVSEDNFLFTELQSSTKYKVTVRANGSGSYRNSSFTDEVKVTTPAS
jgi:hypothetical protein